MYMQDRGKGDNPKMYVTILLMYHFIEEYHCMANVNIYNDKIIFSSMGCSIYTYIVSSKCTMKVQLLPIVSILLFLLTR
jgi:hypothetical protein